MCNGREIVIITRVCTVCQSEAGDGGAGEAWPGYQRGEVPVPQVSGGVPGPPGGQERHQAAALQGGGHHHIVGPTSLADQTSEVSPAMSPVICSLQ